MAYLIVLAVDNSPFDKGDVTSWRTEGATDFGVKMLENPMFRMIHVPDMSDDAANCLVAAQPGDVLLNQLLKRRAFKLDFSKLPVVAQADIAAGKDTTATYADIKTATVAKIVATNVLGPSEVIG